MEGAARGCRRHQCAPKIVVGGVQQRPGEVGGEVGGGAFEGLAVERTGALAGFEALTGEVFDEKAHDERRRDQRQEREQQHQGTELPGFDLVRTPRAHPTPT